MTGVAATIAAARGGDKRAIAQLVTAFEDRRVDASVDRAAIMAVLADAPIGRVVGVTGAPGVGKSTLVGGLAAALCAAGEARVAVVAVDPSSPITGGAFLGDRTRVRFAADDHRLYFRSQASGAVSGGVAATTHSVCRLLARLFSTVLVETVGVGQGEIEVVRFADSTWLLLQPHGGDAVQFLKAGLMEVPDGFIINKADLGSAATATAATLGSALRLTDPARATRPVIVTSAVTGLGVAAIVAAMMRGPSGGIAGKDATLFERWLVDEFGQAGVRQLAAGGITASELVARYGGFDGAQRAFIEGIPSR